MVGNYYTLLAVADSLNGLLPGRALGTIFSQERDELVVGFEDFDPVLVVSCRAGETTCFLHGQYSRARRNSVELLAEARRRVIERVWLPAADRVLMLSCRDGSALALQLYSPHANVLLTSADGTVLDAFKRARELRGHRFQLRATSSNAERGQLRDHLRATPAVAAGAVLRGWMPELGSTMIDELLFRCGLDTASEISEVARLEHEAEQLAEELHTGRPRVGRQDDTLLFSLIPLHHLQGYTVTEFNDLHEAIRFTLYRRRSARVFLERKKLLLRTLRLAEDRTMRSLRALRAGQGNSSRADRYQRFGELLLMHLHEIPPTAVDVELPDSSGIERIPLDPSLGVARTAQRYFEKARTARRTAQESLARATSLEHRHALILALADAVEACHNRHELEELMELRRSDADALGLKSAQPDQTEIPFRVFVVEGGFEVWAGKNSANNDLLTLRYARPNDLWFHARGSGGSHVILRRGSAPGEPGKRAKEQAAAIAAYYSKMRNASVVPVTVTAKKHVRKPRGAPAGTVQVERESVVFAAPALPQHATPPTRHPRGTGEDL